MRLSIYSIWYCKTDNVEKSLRDEEEGCAALTFWEWTPETIEDGASAWSDLPYFIKAGFFEMAIKSAVGRMSNVKRNEFSGSSMLPTDSQVRYQEYFRKPGFLSS